MKVSFNTLLLVLLALSIFFFITRECNLSCENKTEGMYLAANQGPVMLGDPSRPSEQLKALKAQGASEIEYGASLAIE